VFLTSSLWAGKNGSLSWRAERVHRGGGRRSAARTAKASAGGRSWRMSRNWGKVVKNTSAAGLLEVLAERCGGFFLCGTVGLRRRCEERAIRFSGVGNTRCRLDGWFGGPEGKGMRRSGAVSISALFFFSFFAFPLFFERRLEDWGWFWFVGFFVPMAGGHVQKRLKCRREHRRRSLFEGLVLPGPSGFGRAAQHFPERPRGGRPGNHFGGPRS